MVWIEGMSLEGRPPPVGLQALEFCILLPPRLSLYEVPSGRPVPPTIRKWGARVPRIREWGKLDPQGERLCHFGRGAQPRRRSVVSGLLALELTSQGVGLEALLGVLVLPEPTKGEVWLATPKPRPRTTRRALRATLWLQGPLRDLGTSWWGPGRPGHAVCALPGAGLMRKSESLTSHSLPWNSGRKKKVEL